MLQKILNVPAEREKRKESSKQWEESERIDY